MGQYAVNQRNLYHGHGPSSSHTIGPDKAVNYLLNKYHNIKFVKVTLFAPWLRPEVI